MSSPVFVCDAQGLVLMPTSAAYARRLLRDKKAHWKPHHAMPLIQLSRTIEAPVLRPIAIAVKIHLHTAELIALADSDHRVLPLLHVIIDLRSDLSTRLRRRAGHRHRRRARSRFRRPRTHGIPYKLRRPSLARSQWGHLVRRRSHPSVRPRLKPRSSPVARWRAQAIGRVVAALQRLMPISHICIVSPLRSPPPAYDNTLRARLIAEHGADGPHGSRIAMCAYCGTSKGRIELEHILPLSRGGTDGKQNRVLACAACNAKKGARMPAEAGMPILTSGASASARPNRAGSYALATARQLVAELRSQPFVVAWPTASNPLPTDLPASLAHTILGDTSLWPRMPSYVAKPIGRPTKQQYSARNYPLSTPLTAGYRRIGSAIKRRIQTNRALAITSRQRRTTVTVVPADGDMPEDASLVITLGHLAEAKRAGAQVKGIVCAIHSTGRLTLLVPDSLQAAQVTWRRVVVSPKQGLRILSTDPVIFLKHVFAN